MPGSYECPGKLAVLLFSIALVAVCGCSAGGPAGLASGSTKANSAELLNEIIEGQREFDEAMISAVDRPTAEKAKIVMEKAYEKMLNTTRKLEKANGLALASGAMTEADFRELEAKVREERKASDAQCRGHRDRIMNDPEIKAVLKPVFDRIDAGPLK